jgi:hypothetical protein
MKYELDGIDYNVIINKKNNKNLYIRVKEDMNIYVSCNRIYTHFDKNDRRKLYFHKKGENEKCLNSSMVTTLMCGMPL